MYRLFKLILDFYSSMTYVGYRHGSRGRVDKAFSANQAFSITSLSKTRKAIYIHS